MKTPGRGDEAEYLPDSNEQQTLTHAGTIAVRKFVPDNKKGHAAAWP